MFGKRTLLNSFYKARTKTKDITVTENYRLIYSVYIRLGKPKSTGVGSLSLLQRIFLVRFPMQELNQGLLCYQFYITSFISHCFTSEGHLFILEQKRLSLCEKLIHQNGDWEKKMYEFFFNYINQKLNFSKTYLSLIWCVLWIRYIV